MDLLATLLIAVGLSMDCLAVSIAGGISVRGVSTAQMLRASLSFGIFQAGMLALGWLAGQMIVDIIESFDHWVAFGLLSFVGIKMIREALKSEAEDHKAIDITKGFTLLTLSLATSIDSLAVGLGMGFLGSGVILAAIIIGSVTSVISAVGFRAGKRIGVWLGRWAELFGGIVLIGIGLRVLLTHIFQSTI